MYATNVYSESPPRKSVSPTSMKRCKNVLEADIDALKSHSSDTWVWDPIGKTPEEIAAWCAEYECDYAVVTGDRWPCAREWVMH